MLHQQTNDFIWFQIHTHTAFDHNMMSSTCLQLGVTKTETPPSSSSSVFVGILVTGLLAALAIPLGYLKCQRRTDTKGVRLVSTFSVKNGSTIPSSVYMLPLPGWRVPSGSTGVAYQWCIIQPRAQFCLFHCRPCTPLVWSCLQIINWVNLTL